MACRIMLQLCMILSIIAVGTTQEEPSENGWVREVSKLIHIALDDVIHREDLTPVDWAVVNWTDPDSISQFFQEYDNMSFAIGYLVCAGISILLGTIVSMAALVLCCRCCCCPPTKKKREGKNAGCARGCCGILLLLLTTAAILGCVCLFQMIIVMNEEVAHPGTAFKSVSTNIAQLDYYGDTTQDELWQATEGAYNETAEEVKTQLNQLPDESFQYIMDTSGLQNDMQGLGGERDVLITTSESLELTYDTLEELELKATELETNFSTISHEIETALGNCVTSNCNEVMAMVSNFETLNYTTILQTSGAVEAFQSAVLSFNTSFSEAEIGLVVAKNDLRTEVTKYTIDIISQINSAGNEIGEFLQKTDDVFDKLELSSLATTIETYPDDNINNTVYYTGTFAGLLCLAGIIAAILLVYILGLMYGACCPRPKPARSGCCTRAAGSTCLNFGLFLFFLFFWLLALVSLLVFLTGGPVHTVICRNIKDPSQSSFIDDIIQSIPALKLDFQDGVNISEIYTSCRMNESLYKTLRFDENPDYNLTSVIDLDIIEEEIDQLKNQDIVFPPLDIDTNSLYQHANELESEIHTLNIHLSTVGEFLKETVTNISFTDLIRLLESIPASDTQGDTITEIIIQIASLSNLVENMENDNLKAANDINITQSRLSGVQLVPSLDSLNATVNDINTNGTLILSTYIDLKADATLLLVTTCVDTIIYNVENEVGRCEVVYSSYNNIIHTACVEFLDVYNGIWFCIAWCLIFLLPALFMAFKLSDLYEKSLPYAKNQTVPYEQPKLTKQPRAQPPVELSHEPVYVVPHRRSRQGRDEYVEGGERSPPYSPMDPYGPYDYPQREPTRYITRPVDDGSHYYRPPRYS